MLFIVILFDTYTAISKITPVCISVVTQLFETYWKLSGNAAVQYFHINFRRL
jgi:hypothetical protein